MNTDACRVRHATSKTKVAKAADLAATLRRIERLHRDADATTAQLRALAVLSNRAAEFAAHAPTERLKAALDAALRYRTLGHSVIWVVAGDALVSFEQFDALATWVKDSRALQMRLQVAQQRGHGALYRALRRAIDQLAVPYALLVPLEMADLRGRTYAQAA